MRRELVPEDKVLAGKVVAVRCAHGEIVRYPLAELEVTVDGRKIAITAGVAEKLPVQLLLGRDVAELFSLLCADSRANSVDIAPVVVADVGETVAVTTRAQSRSTRGTIDSGSETVATSSNTALDDTVDNVGAEFDEDLFEGGTERRRMTRSQKRLERHQYTSEGGVGATTEKSKWGALDMTPTELQEAQRTDPTLATARKIAEGNTDLAGGEGFYYRGGLLYIPPLGAKRPYPWRRKLRAIGVANKMSGRCAGNST